MIEISISDGLTDHEEEQDFIDDLYQQNHHQITTMN